MTRTIVLLLGLASLSLGCSSTPLESPPPAMQAFTEPLAVWSETTPMPGMPSSYARAVVADGRIFVLGGRSLNTTTDSGQPVLGVYAYDPETSTWEEHTPLPRRVDQPNIAAVGQFIYLLGGKGDKAVFRYDPGAREWTELTERDVPDGVGASAVAVRGAKIYLAGGVIPDTVNPRGVRVPHFVAYDTERDTWEALPDLLEESAYYNAELVGDTLYTFGGSTDQREIARPGKTFAFDFASNGWSEKALLPLAVSSFASAVSNGGVYLIGGITGATGRINEETQVYVPASDSWLTTTAMPTPRFAMSAVSLGGRIYVCGGVKQTGETTFEAVPTVELLER